MRRVVSAILGINTIVISGRKYNLVRYDKNLQFIHIQLTEEINYNDYNMVVKYRMQDGNVLADILEMETNEFDIQIPNEVVQLSGELAIEFTLSGKENDDSLTSLGRIKLTIQDTLESNIDQEEIRVLPTVANVLSRITECTKDGITEIEKSKDEAIEELKKHSDSNVEESKEQINSFASQKQEQLDTYTKTKESQLDEYTLLKQGDMDSYTSTKKNGLDTYEKIKEKQIDDYVSDNSKPSLDKYVKEKNIELDSYTGKKKSELDAYEKTKEGQLDSHTNTKKEELNQHTVQKQGQLDGYTESKKGELDSHTAQKKNELNTHEKAKEKELDSYIITVNKPELDSYANIKKEELNSHTQTKESEITQVTETKKQEITAHSSNELDKFNQGAKQEADKQIGRVVTEGDTQVQRVKDESGGVISRIEELESGKVSKSGDTMTGNLLISTGYQPALEFKNNGVKKGGIYGEHNSLIMYNSTASTYLHMYDNGSASITAKNLSTQSKEVVSAVNELNSKKADLTGSTFTGLVAVKKDTDGEAMVALNSAYGNGDIYSGGSAKGVGFKNRTSKKGLFLGDDGSVKLEAKNTTTSGELTIKKYPNTPYLSLINLDYSLNTPTINMSVGTDNIFTIENTYTNAVFKMDSNSGVEITAKNLNTSSKEVVAAINELNSGKISKRYGIRNVDFNDLIYDGFVYGYEGFKNAAYNGISVGDIKTFSSDWIVQKQYVPYGNGDYDEFVRTKYDGDSWSEWHKIWHSKNFDPSTKLDKSSVVNDLTSGGTDKVLSAEQGNVLKQEIDNLTNEIEQLKQQIAEMQNK